MTAVPELADLPFAEHLVAHKGDIRAQGDYDTVLFEGADYAEPSASSARFLECAFSRVSVSGGVLKRASFRDVWMRGLRLTGTSMTETAWQDVTVADSSLAGVQIYGAALRRVVFSGCKLESVNFRGSKLTDVRFDNCVLRDVDFADAELTTCGFDGSQLSETDFSRAAMDRTDLRGATLGIIIDERSLRGAIVSSGQLAVIAPVLAKTMGIVVRDD